MIDVCIREAYHTANKMFNWGEGFSLDGFGLRVNLFDGEGFVCVALEGSDYVFYLDKMVARTFIKNHQSVYKAGGVLLWVLLVSLFIRVHKSDVTSEVGGVW